VDHCVGEACAVGVQALYLYTHTNSAYDARIGWRTIEERASRASEVTVMRLQLAS